ncbi:MAG: aspartate aminotransferase family protein [Burkholderiaceae bacterium]|nr:aspartate aminotransferase family protein [Burkholderiales bacterium]MCZ8100782.1 aspartate aminotransferase family protein [Burkholderiales bacterium]MCZ8339944.1 aspartate aminotransferase family protein [Burkholderiaceae bacterium]
MSRILHRQTRGTYPRVVSGEGPYLADDTGRRWLDACGGAAVSCLGHGHPAIVAAIEAQARRVAYAHTSFFTTDVAEALADTLVAAAPEGISHAYFVSGGSEAMEAALKMARQYHLERGEPGRTLFVARRQSYHGNTLGALSVGGNMWRREPFAPLLAPALHVSPCYAYRDQRDGETPEAYGERLAAELDAAIVAAGPKRVIGFVAEPVVGATLGAVPAVPGYFRRVREVCDRHGVLLILDEVMCGMGRTGTLYACEQDGVSPDIVTIAKGLGAGYQPIGAALLSRRVFDAFAEGSGFFQHGHTYLGHAIACAAALAVQKVIAEEGLLAQVREMGALLDRELRRALDGHPHVGDIRGRGLFRGVELVADRATKAPFDPSAKLNAKVKQAAFDAGLMCYPMGGTIDGRRGDHVLLAPPYTIDASHVDAIVGGLKAAIDAATASVSAPRRAADAPLRA